MEQPLVTIFLRTEKSSHPDSWFVTRDLASVIVKAANANRSAPHPEQFDVSFSTLLYGFLSASDPCSRFCQRYITSANARRAILARKGLSEESLHGLGDSLPPPGLEDGQKGLVYTISAQSLLRNAQRLHEEGIRSSTPAPLDVRHLLAAYIYRPASHGAELEEMRLSRYPWSKAFRNWIADSFMLESGYWEQVERDTFQHMGDSTPAAESMPTRVSSKWDRAAFDSDVVLERISLDRDRLGMRPEVERFARLLAAQDIRPPIALGLFGRWGSGKSFFMGMLRKRIDELTETDRHGEYVGTAIQITFNAWHYQDTNLWASLALRIFEGIANHFVKDPSRVAETRRQLHVKLTSSVRLRKDAEDRRDHALERRTALAADLAEAARKRDETDRKLLLQRIGRAWRQLSDDEAFTKGLEDLQTNAATLGISGAVDSIDAVERLQAGLKSLDTKGQALLAAVRGSFATARTTAVSCAWLAALVGLVAAVDWMGAKTGLGFSTGLVQIGGTLGTALTWATRRLNQLSATAQSANDVRSRLAAAWRGGARSEAEAAVENALEDELKSLDAAIQKNTEQISAAEMSASAAEREIQRINAGGLVYDFLQERRTSDRYLAHLGLISTIRQDLEQLRTLLEDLRTEGQKPVDRIILYVDDLDRCQQDKVVEVLQAVHLLLAFDVFNVVVGVDARWLERSLDEAYGSQPGKRNRDAAPSPFRAQNYLEKIFQIPYSLTSLNDGTFAQLVDDLVPTRAEFERDRKADGAEARAPHTVTRDTDPKPTPSTEVTESPTRESRTIDLRETVGTLFFEDFEEEFLKSLYRFIGTPRLAKRLVNIYRLLRIRAASEDFEAFVSGASTGSYRAALLLLAINIGYPLIGRKLLHHLTQPGLEGSFTNALDAVRNQTGPLGLTDDEHSMLATIRRDLDDVGAHVSVPSEVDPYVHWAPRVGRYSFDWQLVTDLRPLAPYQV